MQSDIGLEINPQQIFELAMKGRNIIFNWFWQLLFYYHFLIF
jgi:hypothetical protein